MSAKKALAILAAFGVLSVFFLISTKSPNGSKEGLESVSNGKADERESLHRRINKRPASETKIQDLRLSPIYRSDPIKIKPSQLEGYLMERSRDVTGLLSAYSATKDPSFLSELLLKYPSDQDALAAVLLWSMDKTEKEAAEFLLREKFPNSALPDLMALDKLSLAEEGNLLTAIEVLKEKPELKLSSIYSQESSYDLTLSIVKDPVKAWAYSRFMSGEVDNARARIMRLIKEIAGASRSSSSPETRENGTILAANLMYMLFEDIQAQTGPANNMIMSNQEKEILATLDPTIEFGYDGMKVSDRIKEIDENRNRLNEELRRYAEFFPTASPEQMDKYVEIWRYLGNEEALLYASSTLSGK